MKVYRAEKVEIYGGAVIENVLVHFPCGVYQGFIMVIDEMKQITDLYNASEIKCLRNIVAESING